MKKKFIKDMLTAAREGNYAIPHFNFTCFFDLQAIMEAASEMRAPIFVASLPKVAETYDPILLRLMVDKMREKTGCTAILHLDHSKDIELCKRAVNAGYNSVMIDKSDLSLENNISEVLRVVDLAKSCECLVEGEIGRIRGRSDEGDFSSEDYLVSSEDAFTFSVNAGVDLMAVGIGTAHGFYEGKPQINIKRLKEIDAAVSIPLVLHGGTGIPKEDVRKCIQSGIVKVNVGTIIRYTYLSALQREITNRGAQTPPIDLIVPAVTDDVKSIAKDWILTCMANNRI